MNEEIERLLASACADVFAAELILECLLMTHPEPSKLLALIEQRIAEKRASTGLTFLSVGDREEQSLSDAMDRAWGHWLSLAQRHLRT